MAISIIFGLLFITPCIVFEVHGGRQRIEIETPESVSNTNEGHNYKPASDHNTGDVFRNNGDSSFSSFPSMKDFGRFGFSSFDNPASTGTSFAGSDPFRLQRLSTNSMFGDMRSMFQNPTKLASFSSIDRNNDHQNAEQSTNDSDVSADADGLKTLPGQRLKINSMYDDMPSLFRNPTKLTRFPSIDRNNDHQNAKRSINDHDVSVDADGLKPLSSQRYPTGVQNIMSSVLDRMKMPILSGLQPMSQGNEDGNQLLSNMRQSLTKFKIQPLHYDGMKGMMMEMHSAQCCINGNCFELKPGETCGGFGKPLQTNRKKNQQQPISSYQSLNKLTPGLKESDGDSISSGFGDQNIFNSYPSGNGIKYVNSNNGLDSYESPSGPLNHPYVGPIGVGKKEAAKIRNDVLERTNYHRKNHNMPELKLNEELNNYAQEWANKIVNRDLQHRSDHIYGENLFKGKIRENVGKVAVDEFYDEIALYSPNDSERGISGKILSIGHLTQLLWKGSKLLGVGVSKNKDGEYTIVCNYDPEGNVTSLFKKNLPIITQEQVDEGKKREEEKQKNRATQYTVVQSPTYTYSYP